MAAQGPQDFSNLPPQLHGTLGKDKKPFTYTPGGKYAPLSSGLTAMEVKGNVIL